MRLGPVGLALFALAFAGCGGSGDDSAESDDCIIFASGRELCGDEAEAYCMSFQEDLPDRESRDACAGALDQPTAAERQEAELQGDEQEDKVEQDENLRLLELIEARLGPREGATTVAVAGTQVQVEYDAPITPAIRQQICDVLGEAVPDADSVIFFINGDQPGPPPRDCRL